MNVQPELTPDDRTGFPIIGVGASAGGLEALREMFGGFKGQSGMAFVVVQHLDPTHESLMAQLIERFTSMHVKQAEGGEMLEPDHVYVIPPGHGLALNGGILSLTEFTDPRGMRRPIDDFFESLAEDRGERAACVILSGTGADGSRGLRAIKEHGGLCVVQEPDTAAYDGMPTSAIGTGLVDIVAEPGKVLDTLASFFDRGTIAEDQVEEAGAVADHVDDLCEVLREAVGHDFSRYKRSTLNRRIARRMQVLGIEDGAAYLARLRSDPDECDALFRDLLINVTKFFRDPEEFQTLNSLVIDRLVANARNREEIRVWVPGCSSGEEAYSLAMMFAAANERHGKHAYVQIFATDIDDAMLDIARSATYPASALTDIPAMYRDEYIIAGSDKFAIAPRVRDMVRFSVHNLVRDPPYSKIDLVSCRNLLIYFDESLQETAVPLFHFALKQDGALFLGSSEAIGRFEDLFEPIDRSARVFRRRSVKGNYSLVLPNETGATARRRRSPRETSPPVRAGSAEITALRMVADKYAPVSLLIDRDGCLLDRWGPAARFLDFPERLERTVHVPSLARPGLRELIGPLIRQVGESGRRAGANDVEIRTQFGAVPARVVCEKVDESSFLFVIRETGELKVADDDFDAIDPEDGQRQFLEEELQLTRHRLRSTVEELETSNEELKSSNEEMMSMNEELQSTNEELTTVNDELKNKVDQLTVANADLRNFFDSTQLAVLVVDAEMNLRSYTDAALDLFPIGANFIGRPLADLPSKLDAHRYVDDARAAAIDGEQTETSIHSAVLGAEFILRVLPYRLLDGKIDGATLVFTDVTEALSLERNLREERERLRLALEVAEIGIWEYEPATDRIILDETERRLLALSPDDPGDSMERILARLTTEDRDRINRALRMAIEGAQDFDETFRLPLGDGEYRWLHGLGKKIDIAGKRKFIGTTFDITSDRILLDQRELMIREMNHRVKNLFSVIAAMITIAAREKDDVESFAESLRERIHALGRSHSLTNEAGVSGEGRVQLDHLVDTVIKPSLAGQSIDTDGEPLTIENYQITSLALILHEWATNASKYGALATKDGSIRVEWAETDGNVELTWTEQGSAVGNDEEPATPGFGTRLVETAARQLQGSATGGPTEDGYRRTLTFPMATTTG